MKKPIFLVSVLALFSLISCTLGEDPDIQKPVIKIQTPENWQSVHAGSEFSLSVMLEDETELGNLNMNIHENFKEEGHEHASSSRKAANDLKYFAFNKAYPLEGATQDVSDNIAISADAMAGPYHLSMEATDAAGNGTSFEDNTSILQTILITNDSQAKVQLEGNPQELEVSAGEVLDVRGLITDNVGMFGEVIIELKHEEEGAHDDHDHSGERTKEGEYYYMDFDIDPVSSVDLATLIGDQTIYIPANIDEEELVLVIKVIDDQGNMTVHRTHVHII